MNFQPVDEPRVGKVRIHVDVLVDDSIRRSSMWSLWAVLTLGRDRS